MGTKLEPGEYDCHSAAADDEPMFTLLARDPIAPVMLEMWAEARRQAVGPTDPEEFVAHELAKAQEAEQCAMRMRAWKRKNPARGFKRP